MFYFYRRNNKIRCNNTYLTNDFNNCFSFVDILYDRFAIKHSICINYSYDISKKIKKEIKLKTLYLMIVIINFMA